jgi:hypothetical protein
MTPPPPAPEPEPEPRAAWEELYGWNEEPQQPQQEVSRARAIFDASNEVQPFTPEGFDFAMAEEEAHAEISPAVQEPQPAQPGGRAKAKPQRVLGMTPLQLAVIGGLVLALFCILAIFAYVVFF